ncbi:MAG: SLC13 family permease [Nitriliruptorales bacterium]
MTIAAWLTIIVVVGVAFVLARELLPPAPAVLAGLAVLLLARVVPPGRAFAGFAAPATITVAMLYIVARAVRDTGLIDVGTRFLLGAGRGDRRTLARLSLTTAAASSIVTNTPIVATLAPVVRSWAERHGRPASRYLMPLSFAAILGGTVTVIGTSTNLLVSGLLAQSGQPGLNVFELTPVGLPLAVLGTLTLVALAPVLLPERQDPVLLATGPERQYAFRAVVDPGGPLDGVHVRDAGLRDRRDVYLVRIERGGADLRPIGPDEILHGNDILVLLAGPDDIRELADVPGLGSGEDQHVALLGGDRHGLFEAVIGAASPLVGRTPKEVAFRGRYGAAIVAVHRAGGRVGGSPAELRLRSGDALLVLSEQDFADHWRDRRDFVVVVPLDEHAATVDPRGAFTLAVLVTLVATSATGLLSLVEATLAAVFLLLVTRTVSLQKARGSVDMEVVLLIAGAFGLGAAVETSGLAEVLASGVSTFAMSAGPVVALAVLFVATAGMTEIVTNAAAAGIMFPIALEVAARTGSDPRGFAVAIAIAASASFLTPIGYQTNTIVYGLGGYRYGDYWRLGLPLTGVAFVVALVVIPLVWSV